MNFPLAKNTAPSPLPLHPRPTTPVYDRASYPATVDSDSTAPPFVTFSEAFGALLRRKWLLAALVSAGAVIGLAIAFSQAPVYQAKALIEVQGVNENFLNRRELDPTTSENGVM